MISAEYHQTKAQIRDDGQFIEQAKADPKKFEPLYTKYYESILRFVYQRVDDKQDAYDVVSQVFLNALENLHKYEHRGLPLSSWLFRIAINELNQFFRKKKKFRAVNLDTIGMLGLMEEMEDSDVEGNLSRLKECLTRLSSADFLIIEMRFFEERPFKEIGDILEITENNAKVRTYRALDRLKRVFK